MITFFKHCVKRIVIALLSDYVHIRYGSWWSVREEGLKRSHQRWGKLLSLIFERQVSREGGWIGRGAHFAGPPCFPHGMKGIFISDNAQVGRECVLFQHAMIVSHQLLDSERQGAPMIGDHVYIGCGAVIVGSVTIGDGCRLGTNVVVHHDLPAHSVAVCQPAKIIQRNQPMDNRHISVDQHGVFKAWEDGQWVEAHRHDHSSTIDQ